MRVHINYSNKDSTLQPSTLAMAPRWLYWALLILLLRCSKTWPREFIDHAVLSGIHFDPALDYELFTPGTNGKDCDHYRRLYFQAKQTPLSEISSILEQMDMLSEHHPYGEALRYRFYMETGREQEGKNGFCQLAAAYPDNALLAIAWAELCLEDGNAEEAERIASHILDLEPEHIGAKTVYAKCLAEKKQYHEAKECAYDLIHVCSENPMLMEQLVQLMKSWNEQLICQREAAYAQTPENTDNIIELAWCYAQNDRVDDAIALAQKIDPNYEDAFAYHNLMGQLYYNTGKFSEALSHLQTVETILRSIADDRTKETQKRIARLPEMLQYQGNCLTQLGRTAEAKEKFEQALQIAPEDTEILLLMGKILFSSGDYQEAVEAFRQLLQLTPDAWVAELLMALCLYHMRQYREAFDAVNRAIAIQGNDLSLYVIKMQILVRNEIFGDVHKILNFLKENGVPEDIATDFIRAELTELEKKDANNALEQYRTLQKRVEAGEDLIWSAELYFYAATCKRQLGDLEGARLYYLKVLELDPKHIDAFHGLAFIYDTLGNYEESLKLLDQGLAIMEKNIRPFDPMVEHKANVLRRMGRFEEALSFANDAPIDYFYFNFLQLQFDICCQAGWWNRARQVLNRWKRANRNGPEPMPANIRLYLLQGKLFKAALAIESAKHKLPFRQVQDFQLQLAELEQNYPRQVELLSQWVQADPTDDHALTRLALAYWHMDNQKAAQDAAQKALTLLDNTLSQRLTDEPLYRSRRSLILAILGKTQEAKAELSRTRTLPLCHFCAYSSCKDADIYEAQIEEILGNTEKAQKLYTAGKAKWPDDLDFISGELRLKKKGRK